MARKICVFTGSRAEYGLLAPLMTAINGDQRLKLQLIVSGAHLETEFGETWREIERDGFSIDAKIDMKLTSDVPVALAKGMALCLSGCAEALDRLKPDVLVVLGDRYEVLAAAEAAVLLRVPVAHFHGGETTEGAIDDAIRHAVTQLSELHFPAAEFYRQRIIKLGANENSAFCVGAPGLDYLKSITLLEREALESETAFQFGERNLLVTYHPATAQAYKVGAEFQNLLDALDQFPGVSVIMTKSNADHGGRQINRMVDEYAARHAGRVLAVASLGQRKYLSVLAMADAVIGNSSSGIIEAPAFGTPTVNVGARQRGRLRAPSIIDCPPDTAAIVTAIRRALSPEMKAIAQARVSPYGRGGASQRAKDILASIDLESLRPL